jgi:uncharacterized SAM-binding protein YcdF (DUF218 family)
MFFFLSKALNFLLVPHFIVMFLLFCAAMTRRRPKTKKLILCSILILFVFSNNYLVNKAFRWWEGPFVNLKSINETYDVGIVLTGGLISIPNLQTDHPELGNHSNRFFQAYLLYKEGKIRKILITGTDGTALLKRNLDEAWQASRLLIKWGVPEKDIILERKSRNTRENALFSKAILDEQVPQKKVLLITSAFHIRRSVGCFRKVGIDPDFFPTDFYSYSFKPELKDFILPDQETYGNAYLLWHEWIGFIVYKAMGYC